MMVCKQSKGIVGEIINRQVLPQFISLLSDIYKAIQNSKGLKFNSSSLLLVYDAGTECQPNAVLKLIDFESTEIRPDDLPDVDVLEGIVNLLSIFKQIYDFKGRLGEY